MTVEETKAIARQQKESYIQKIIILDPIYEYADLESKTLKQLEKLYAKVHERWLRNK